MVKLLLALIAVIILAPFAQAQVINAASCSATDVQTAFNAVTASTTTVNVPSCPAGVQWTTQVTLNVPSGSTTLTVQGSTTVTGTCFPSCTASDQTVIIDNYTSGNSLLLITTASASSVFRFTGFTFQSIATIAQYQGLIYVSGNSQNARFDHNHFTPINNSAGMRISGCVYGVADHNIFDLSGVSNGIQEYQGACGGDSLGLGSVAWTDTTDFGTAKSFFMENNLFNNGATNDCTNGGRFVSRYNTINSSGSPPAIQDHPTVTSGGSAQRGCRSAEIYHNQANATGYVNTFFWLDSGPALIWNNTIPSSSAAGGTGYRNVIYALSSRSDNSTYGEAATPNGWGYCGTNFNGTGSAWDGNSPTTTGYPCIDGVGRGKSDLIVNDFPNTINQVTGTIAWPHQTLEPVYEWADAYSPVPNNPSDIWSQNNSVFALNRDAYLGTTNAGTPISFNGTVGVGVGTLTPTTAGAYTNAPNCTAGPGGTYGTSPTGSYGVGYFDTTNQTLYVCTATNTWMAYYTPYTYPHPLAGGTPQVNTPTFSPVAGSYSSTQSVTISTTTSGATICWTNDGTTPTADGAGTCTHGTTYTITVSVPSPLTLKAIGSKSGDTDSTVGSAAYVITSAASTPSCTPGTGSYSGTQSVSCSTATGPVMCWNTTGSPATDGASGCAIGTIYGGPITVPASEVLYIIAGGTGYSDSSIASYTYTISATSTGQHNGRGYYNNHKNGRDYTLNFNGRWYNPPTPPANVAIDGHTYYAAPVCTDGSSVSCTITASFSIPTTGDAVDVIVGFCPAIACTASPIGTITLTDGTNTYTAITAANSASTTTQSVYRFVACNATAGTYMLVAHDSSGTDQFYHTFAEAITLSGARPASCVDSAVSNKATGTGTAASVTSVGNVTNANEVAIAAIHCGGTSLSNTGTYTTRDINTTDGVLAASYSNPTQGATTTAAATCASSTGWWASLLSIQP